MNIESILESFNLDPLNEYNVVFENGDTFVDELITEFATRPSVKVKNVLKTIIDAGLKVLKWIGKALANIGKWILGMFKRKTKTTPDKVISSVVKSKGTNSKSGTTNIEQIKKDVASSLTISSKASSNGSNTSSNVMSAIKSVTVAPKKVNIPSNPKSVTKMTDATVLTKPLLLEFDAHGRDKVKINLNSLFLNTGGVKGQDMAGCACIMLTLCYIFESTLVSDMSKIMDLLIDDNGNDPAQSKTLELVEQYNSKVNNLAQRINIDNGIEITVDQVTKVSKDVNSLMDKFGELASVDFETTSSTHLKVVNDMLSHLNIMQMSINALTRAMNGVYTIDEKYLQSIDDIGVLDNFVKGLIDGGIPSKYIGHNVYLASSKNIHSGKGDKDNPIWGQSRVVLFPPDESKVYKIALSGWGIKANESELEIYQKASRTKYSKIFARTMGMESNGCVNTMERIPSDREPSVMTVMKIKALLGDFMDDCHVNLDLTADIHEGNVGIRRDGSSCCIDYGLSYRISSGD